MLTVADNMHRALEAVGAELRQSTDANVKAMVEGVELTERELLKALEKNGVKKFSPQGEKFDPDGTYVRRWVPELAGLPAAVTPHRPLMVIVVLGWRTE